LHLLRNNTGLSLIEILIAITLLAFVMLGVISITDDSMNTKLRVTTEDKEYMSVETAMSIMEWDFSHIYSPLYFAMRMMVQNTQDPNYLNLVERLQVNKNFDSIDEDGRPIPIFENPDKSTFEFFTSSNRRKFEDQRQSNYAWVRYAVEDVSIPSRLGEAYQGKALVRYYWANNPYSEERLDRGLVKPQILLKNVEELEIKYWDYSRREFLSSLDQITDGQFKIDGIRVKLNFKDGLGNERTLIRVFRCLFPRAIPNPQNLINPMQPGQTDQAGAGGNQSDDADD